MKHQMMADHLKQVDEFINKEALADDLKRAEEKKTEVPGEEDVKKEQPFEDDYGMEQAKWDALATNAER